MSRPARRERSLLATPGSDVRMIGKALATDADVVMLDLEDAVAPGEKAAARATVAAALRDGDWRGRPRCFRMNALDTVWWYRDLVEVVEAAGPAVDLIVVPKVDHPSQVTTIATLLTAIEAAVGMPTPIGLELQVETAAGALDALAIARASDRAEAMVFGPGDFAASAGMPLAAIGMPDNWDADYPGHRFGYPMQQVVLAARAAGLRAVDGPFADFRDADGFRRSARVARALGFDGKWCIHPAQVALANDAFSPSEAEVDHARRVLAATAEAHREGRGAATFDGRMIDGASVRMAEATLARLPDPAACQPDTLGEAN